MKERLFSFFVILSFFGYGQNWNVFNNSYRYNYKFNNSSLISNVMFVDSVEQTGADTTYYLNRIGVVNGNTLHINKPQFLMKKIVKFANGDVQMQDTVDMLIIPTCSVSQTWIFGTNANLTATCVSISTVNIFSTIDSVRTIILSNNDSVLITKQFGIIQFPQPSQQNKYYKLVGIEAKAIYTLTALYGEKVPNAWDIYNYDVGDKFRISKNYQGGGTSPFSGCYRSTTVILSKTVTPTGYSYGVDGEYRQAFGMSYYAQDACSMSPTVSFPYSAPIINFSSIEASNLFKDSLLENRMYPGMITYDAPMYNICYLEKDGNGIYYKYFGVACYSTLTPMPNANAPEGFESSSTNTTVLYHWGSICKVFAQGFGQVSWGRHHFEYAGSMCMTNAVKNNVDYFNPWTLPPNDIGIREYYDQDLLLFPNPANTQLQLPVDHGLIKLFDPFGKLVKQEKLENKSSLDISEFPNGVYMIEIQNDSFKTTQKIIIQH